MAYRDRWDDRYGPYVSVAEKRQRAARELAKLRKKTGRSFSPVALEGRDIAKSFWGKSWCANLERYSDYATRLPRGRSYVRNGSVVDLQIAKGEVTAMVAGSELYDVRIKIAPVEAARWKAICRDCAGSVDSLIEILQGRLAQGVMDRVCRQGDGLFPAPQHINLSCSCPDWAEMCKHVAAVLYGIGARLDQQPELLFLLCDVDVNELLAGAGPDLTLARKRPSAEKLLDESDLAALFGLEMAEAPDAGVAPAAPKPLAKSKTKKDSKPAAKQKNAAVTMVSSRGRTAVKAEPTRPAKPSATKPAARRPRKSA
jgi:uncharacterized Zn finger protein